MNSRCLAITKDPPHDVVADLLSGLKARGWHIETLAFPFPSAPQSALWRRVEAMLASRFAPFAAAARLARRAQREVAGANNASAWLDAIDDTLARRSHDVVLAFIDVLPVGVARLVARAKTPAVLVSLVALTQEHEQRRALPLVRAFAGCASRSPLHRDLLKPIARGRVPTTVFPSKTWHEDSARAGVAPDDVHVITFGVPIPSAAIERRTPGTPARLLWVGRLSPEKGLHVFLDALPSVLRTAPVTLTAIAEAGPEGYADRLHAQIDRLALNGTVTMHPPVAREAMRSAFHTHDVLLFHSIMSEPVAQVMLHAAAAGIPIVGPASGNTRSVLREGETAWCYASTASAHVGHAIRQVLDADPAERIRRSQALREAVRAGHDLAHTIDRYDALLRRVASGQRSVKEHGCLTVHC